MDSLLQLTRFEDRLSYLYLEKGRGEGSCLQAWNSPTEQGFQFRVVGEPSRELVEFEGLHLVSIATT